MKDQKTTQSLTAILGTCVLFLLISTAAWASSPVLFYSDLTAGPNTGGQNNLGVFVTVWGNNFGSVQGSSIVTVGSGAVTNIQTWTNTEICFQLGSSTSTGNIVVTTSGGTSNGLPFTVQSGNIYFVDPTQGTNGTGTFASPFNHLYYAEQKVVAGDTVYVRASTVSDQIEGHAGWHTLLMPEAIGTQSKPIAWIAYPNETVTLKSDGGTATWTAGSSGGTDNVEYIFRGNNNAWQTIAKFNLVFTGSSQNLESDIDTNGVAGWRVIGNNVTSTFYTYCQICTGGDNSYVLGNEVHDSGASITNGNEEHSIYEGGPSNSFEIGWNYMHGNKNTGWEITSYHNGPRIGLMHDNLIIANTPGSVKGILVDGCGDGGSGNPDTFSTMYTNNIKAYNNVIIGTGQASNGGAMQTNCGTNYIYNNTIYNSGTETQGVVQFETGGVGPGGGNPVEYFANNIIYASNTGLYLSDGNGNAPTWANFALLSNNNFYGEGNGPTQDANAKNANPQFVSPGTSIGSNFQLQAASPDINAGYNTIAIVAKDLAGLLRSSVPTIGAYEYTSASSTPVVAITSPSSGINLTVGSNVSITATASENNGTISNISLYNGATLLGSSSSSPYTYTMTNPALGTYTLTAVATDAKGVATTSSPVIVIIIPQVIIPPSPVVTITSPASGSSYAAGSDVTVTTTASETNGTITNISLYNGSGLLLGSSSSSPYNFVDTNMAAGGYSFYAVATDATGVSTMSSAITVTVTAPPAPVVAITSPNNGSSMTAGSTLNITASASETNGTIAQVQFYNGSTMLGSSSTSPYTYAWTSIPAGSYTLTAKAMDANNASTMSSAVAVTVTGSTTPTVSITSPVNGNSFAANSNITITASASVGSGTITKVSFYNGATLLGTDTSSPYTFTWNNVATGNYNLTAKAYNGNKKTTSAAVAVTVTGLPTASLTANNTSFTAPAIITLTATASETNGTIAQVQFYNGATLLGTDTISPYTFSWSNVSAGSYSLTAVATDANGVSTTSSAVPVTVTVLVSPVAPVFTAQPSSMTVTAPATATFSVSATGTPAPTFQWMQSVNGGAFTNISGATNSFYTTPATIVANSGTQFECVISNASGSVTSNAASLTVNPAPAAPVFTAQPSSVTLTAPATATFSVSATGTPAPTFQWMQSVNGGAFSNISGATNSSYTTSATTIADNGTQFKCVISNASGSVTSNIASLTVNPAPVAPVFTAQPVSVTVTAPTKATFSVAATGTPAPAFQWMQSVNGGAFTNISGATSSSYTTAATTTADSGTQFECVISNASGSVTSNMASLTVNLATAAPVFTAQPSSMTVTAPATATFSVSATGTPAPTFQWMQSVNGGAFSNISGATSSSYTTAATTTANSGTKFECVISNSSGSVTSNVASLTVNPAPVAPVFTAQPSSVTLTAPATATFSVSATGTPAPTFQWMQGVNGGAFSNINGATNSSYTTAATTVANNGTQFECVISNASGSVTSNAASLIVNPAPAAPVFTVQPVSVTLSAPASATFSVAATGTPVPAFQWMQSVNGGAFTNISGATSSSYTTSATTVSDNGTQFECVVSNASGSVTSNMASLTVNAQPSLPTIILTSPSNNAAFTPPTNIFLSADASEANGTIAQVQFYMGATLLYTATSAPYNYTWTTNILLPGFYTFTAIATDSRGIVVVSAPATILINPPFKLGKTPSGLTAAITSPNSASSITPGSNITITANASETNGNISEVYFYNGASFLGASSVSPYSYTWANVPAGSYVLTAKAVDANGASVTSSPVAITVVSVGPALPVVAITSPANGSTLVSGSSLNITANASEVNGTITQVQFYNGSTLIGTDSASPYSLNLTNVAAGTYNLTVKALDANGASTTSGAVTVNVVAPSLPVVALTSPVSGDSFVTGSNVTITANASELNGTVAQVQFYNGSTLLGTDTVSPYNFTWNNVLSGSYTLTAKVTDINGVSVTSAPVSVIVIALPPTVTITSPVNGSNSVIGSDISITANASEVNGTIAQVEFYNGSTLLGTDSASPYSFSLTNVAAGTYTLTAKATDANGVSTTSSAVTVTVTVPTPVVSITSPANASSLTTGSTLSITASASEASGTIAQVQFYNGSTLLGTSTTSPYNFSLTNAAVGTYNLSAIATDANGVSTTSGTVTVTVADPSLPVVAITNITDGSNFKPGTNIPITVNASGSSGTFSLVQIYNGSTLLYSTTSSSSNFTWKTPLPGTYSLMAQAIDSNGAVVTSAPVAVSVKM